MMVRRHSPAVRSIQLCFVFGGEWEIMHTKCKVDCVRARVCVATPMTMAARCCPFADIFFLPYKPAKCCMFFYLSLTNSYFEDGGRGMLLCTHSDRDTHTRLDTQIANGSKISSTTSVRSLGTLLNAKNHRQKEAKNPSSPHRTVTYGKWERGHRVIILLKFWQNKKKKKIKCKNENFASGT